MRYCMLLLFACLLGATAGAQKNPPPANEVIHAACAQAAQGGKNVLLIFHASWCGWCRKMDSSLYDAAIKKAIDANYEIAHLTVYESPGKEATENPGALQFLKDNGGENLGIPYWFVLDKNGKVLADSQYAPGKNTGCPASAEEVAYFLKVLKNTSSLNETELEAIRKRFRQNE